MQSNEIFILGIESSCDETAAAVIHNGNVLSNVIAGQTVHAAYGGVVPELASRAHQQNIVPVVDQALKVANITVDKLSAIGFTNGPGLMGSLLVGSSFAKALAQGLKIPLIEVNHMHAHIMANFINRSPQLPFLCLTVSGGHTQIVKVNGPESFELLGQTLDDAAGEAFDKTAKVLGLPYPGGPLIDKLAAQGNPLAYKFSVPNAGGYNYSFSGLKTAFINFIHQNCIKDSSFIENNLKDICASFQHSIIDYLMKVFLECAKTNQIHSLTISGGVSANSLLRRKMLDLKQFGFDIYIPDFEYCTDNGAMIGISAYHLYLQKKFTSYSISPFARGF